MGAPGALDRRRRLVREPGGGRAPAGRGHGALRRPGHGSLGGRPARLGRRRGLGSVGPRHQCDACVEGGRHGLELPPPPGDLGLLAGEVGVQLGQARRLAAQRGQLGGRPAVARPRLVAPPHRLGRRARRAGQRRLGALAGGARLGEAPGQGGPGVGVGEAPERLREQAGLGGGLRGLAPGCRGGLGRRHQGSDGRGADGGLARRRRRPPALARPVGRQARPLGREGVGGRARCAGRGLGGDARPLERGDPEELAQDVVALARARPEEPREAPLGEDHRAREGLEAEPDQLLEPLRDHDLAGHPLDDLVRVAAQPLEQVERLGGVGPEAPGRAPHLVAAGEGEAHLAVGPAEAQELLGARQLGRAAVEREADRVEERRLARPGVPGDHHEPVATPVDRLLVVGAEGGEAQLERPHPVPQGEGSAAARAAANASAWRGSNGRPEAACQSS